MYYPFSEGSLAIADQMMSNYYHIAAGNQYPYSVSANNGFTLASATYDIGASDTTFQDAFCVNLHINDSIASADNSLWYLITEETLTDTATSIEFTGLNGDDIEEYRIFAKQICATGNLYMIFNGDSTANYGSQRIRGQSNTVSGTRTTGEIAIILSFIAGVTTTTKIGYNEILLYSKTGNERLMITNTLNQGNSDFIYAIENRGQIWNNSVNTITSIKFYTHNGDSFLTGTNIQIWGRQ